MDEEALVVEDYCAVGSSESLQSFANGRHSFPLFLSIRKKGTHARRLQHLLYVHEKKRMAFAQCVSDKNQSAYTIPVDKESGIRLLPATRSCNPDCILPSELLACKTAPSIVLVKKSFVASAKGEASGTLVLKEGELLFPQEIKHKKKATVFLLAVTDQGQEVTMDLKCNGRFSVSFGADFDLLHTLKTYKKSIKLPMDVSVCQRDTSDSEPKLLVKLQRVGEDWALCGFMTDELEEGRGKVQFRYKTELFARLPYTAQKMVPRNSNSQMLMQLEADYDKAMSNEGDETIYYEEPALDIYEAVESALISNPSYASSYERAVLVASGNNATYVNLSSLRQEGHYQVPQASVPRVRAASCSETSSSMKGAVKLPLPAAVPTSRYAAQMHPESSHLPHVPPLPQAFNVGSAPPKLCSSKAAVKVRDAGCTWQCTPLREVSKEQRPKSVAVEFDSHPRSPERNVAYLKTLDIDMVQWLLSAMNLSQHQERFRAEHVDGEILASCDVECLAELGVTSRIQQLRLAKLIDGTKSAIELLNK